MDFKTIKESTSGIYKELGSKFLSFAFPVVSEEDVRKRLDQLKGEYYDARHHCYGYVLGMENQRYKANDDGEPKHSAGDPILNQIRSFGLTNVLVVVVRYFGGTKLGVSGLIRAYKSASYEALNLTTAVLIYPTFEFIVDFDYDQTSELERVLGNFEIKEVQREYLQRCSLYGRIRKSSINQFKESLLQKGIDIKVLE